MIIVVACAICLSGCHLREQEGDTDAPTAQADTETGEGVSATCSVDSEQGLCNGLDDDCDGLTDEDCTFRLGGYALGAGVVSATSGDVVATGVAGARHFLGTSSDDQWVIRGGLPPRGEGP